MIDHNAPKDLAWTEEAVLDLDNRLDRVEGQIGAPPPEMQDVRESVDQLIGRLEALLKSHEEALERIAALEAAGDNPEPEEGQ